MILKHVSLIVLFILASGCRSSTSSPAPSGQQEPASAQSLRLLVIDDPDLARAIERQWTAHGENPLQTRLMSQQDFLKQQQRRLASDVVIYPSALIGELASRDWLQPLAEQELN